MAASASASRMFFQFFDIKGILAYTTAFILVVLGLRIPGVLRPLERRVLDGGDGPAA